MEATELRIGNFVHIEGKVHKLRSRDIYHIDKSGLKAEPIPLTEDWLKEFGLLEGLKFEQHLYWFNSPITLMRKQIYGDQSHQFLANVEHVHQLQNLYHALTGKELVK